MKLDKWADHFKKLLGNVSQSLDTEVEQIVEHHSAMKTLKKIRWKTWRGFKTHSKLKTAGLDNIPPNIWMTQDFNIILLQLCSITSNREVIERWTEGHILPFTEIELRSENVIDKTHLPLLQPEFTTQYFSTEYNPKYRRAS